MMVFVCQAHDMEEGWIRSMAEQTEREWLAHETGQDKEHAEALGREHVLDMEDDIQDESDWPWYAELPYVVVEPEVIDAWEV